MTSDPPALRRKDTGVARLSIAADIRFDTEWQSVLIDHILQFVLKKNNL